MIDYQLRTNPRARHVKIRVEPPNHVIVVVPKRFSKTMVQGFVEQSQPWIKRQLAKLETKQEFGETPTTVAIFGKKYQKELQFSKDDPIGVRVNNGAICINPIQDTDESRGKELRRFLKSTAEKYIVPRTQQLATLMNTTYQNVSLRQQKTRWGSCSSQGNLQFNWRLVHCPPEVIDYVIIHELAHRTHMNHSSRFWNLVKTYCPEYQLHRGWLKRQGMALG